MEYLKIIVLFVALGSLDAKIISGKCPEVPTKLDFDPVPVCIRQKLLYIIVIIPWIIVVKSIKCWYVWLQYLGNWYQQQGNPTFYQPADAQCVRATYGANGKNQGLNIPRIIIE